MLQIVNDQTKTNEVMSEKMNDVKFPTFEKQQIFDANGQPIEGYTAITNNDTSHVNAIMTNQYEIFNHEQAFDIINSAATALCPEVSPEVNFYKDDGFMKVIYDLPESYNIEVLEGDALRTRLVGMNSVDGSKCLSFHIDFERLICTNGMVGFTREFSFSRKHTKHVKHDVKRLELDKQINTAWVAVKENAMMLKNNKIDYGKGMDAIKALVDRKLFPNKLKNWIESEWKRSSVSGQGYEQDKGGNLWSLYNAFTSAISHDTNKKGDPLTEMQKELYQNRLNNVIMKLAA